MAWAARQQGDSALSCGRPARSSASPVAPAALHSSLPAASAAAHLLPSWKRRPAAVESHLALRPRSSYCTNGHCCLGQVLRCRPLVYGADICLALGSWHASIEPGLAPAGAPARDARQVRRGQWRPAATVAGKRCHTSSTFVGYEHALSHFSS